MEAELTQLRTEVKVLRDKTLNTSLNESFDDSALRDEMDSMRTEMDGMKQQMWAVEAKALESDNRLAEVTKENERLQSALDRVTSEYEMVRVNDCK
ncbi:hypothetical protein SARC_14661 [Sphaeroforma arctica JP610]|uniref:Uncharacterized protein n=1 Tax=Sphaeroforma arctica JP610 TaxID=667725 RepID=A0A0L0F7W4_9EUKA|nr:hypothetical protein SARC_14661 [Sphaeroforma arctica JP610]KNC72779.1 hypothetical protein SARC_14661 [Sphaeroforma arctica JP610]|eukprot:XP_014146681.1 hypothetical protein SARC_14661 [Sphaeroforma arctica JP610]